MTRAKSKSEPNELWGAIKNQAVDMFGLPDQTLEDHISNHKVVGDKLYLHLKSTAALRAVEESVGKVPAPAGTKYDVFPIGGNGSSGNQVMIKLIETD